MSSSDSLGLTQVPPSQSSPEAPTYVKQRRLEWVMLCRNTARCQVFGTRRIEMLPEQSLVLVQERRVVISITNLLIGEWVIHVQKRVRSIPQARDIPRPRRQRVINYLVLGTWIPRHARMNGSNLTDMLAAQSGEGVIPFYCLFDISINQWHVAEVKPMDPVHRILKCG